MNLDQAPLGHDVAYPAEYDPGLLYPIERAANRAGIGVGTPLPFHGADIWNAYELSWLDPRGKPRVAIGRFTVPADTPCIIESKSFKLYLNSLSQTRLPDAEAYMERVQRDVSAAACGPVRLTLVAPRGFRDEGIVELPGETLDDLEVDIEAYTPAPALLRCVPGAGEVEETLTSDLLKSNCPVTSQPDWGSVQIRYRGPKLDRAALLAYIVSFRQHTEFHEHCVERIFTDLMAACRPSRLSVYARYTRRGGLDINPWRATPGWPGPAAEGRSARQ
ncbi:NADPH-dependent 7-cyano-7-deazaguanine reductase QueF [Bordetella genomosp. 9]|uniref:NADPH-dependent 7-cyano-7-deazaguanine reductase n=1 Tax=Bordetella genomosp. 9 TaxID=1416803 RepID=A0A261REL2_9BORD|nr:NADPH-dependent 7-cyano-7-deazaguanine reductase QueF [Bordetella genomosp. 9]OZI23464.1 NADPH-dependent 7-cyano-7-deazaguanine reductase QueF [Bordetella genomosp. 9]